MTIRIDSPQAAVAATPYLFGFTPADSLVMLLSHSGSMVGSMRVDLPDTPDLGWLQTILAGMPRSQPSSAVLIAYADTTPLPFAERIVDWLMEVFNPVLDVVDLVVVHDQKMHSLFASVDGGSDGVPLAVLESHPIVAACIAEGLSKLANRDELEALLDPVHDDLARQVLELLDAPDPDVLSYEQWRDRLERRSLEALLSPADLSAIDVVHIGLACSDIYARDPLITLLLEAHAKDGDRLHAVRDRLVFAVTHLPDDIAGPTAATLALLSWANGEGPAALVAAQRAMTADPSNTLGPLVAEALQHGLPPHTWASVTQDIPMEVLRGQCRRTA